MRYLRTILLLGIFILPLPLLAQNIPLPNPPQIFRVELSDVSRNCGEDDSCVLSIPWIGEYISQLYVFAVSVSALLAAVVIMVAGMMWVLAGGNTSQVENARTYIKGAVMGLILMLGSYVILYTINPKLVRFDGLRLPVIQHVSLNELNELLGGFEGRCSVKTIDARLHPALTQAKVDIINASANKHGIDPFVVAAFVSRETTFNFCDNGVNLGCNNQEYDALGAMQVLPTTAAEVWNLNLTSSPQPAVCIPPYIESSNVKPLSKNGIGYAYKPECKEYIANNPQLQADLGTAYLAKLSRFLKNKGVDNNLALLAAAYFAGPGNAEKLINDEDGSVIADMPKTKQYSDALQSIYKDFCGKVNGEILIDAQPTPLPPPT